MQEIDFTLAKTKKKQLDQAISLSEPVDVQKKRKLPDVKELNVSDLATFFSSLDSTGKKPVLLSLVPGYAEKYKPKALDAKYPQVLTDLYDETYTSVSLTEILWRAEEIFPDVQVTVEEANNCELDTRGQANCKQWFIFRSGRLTASRIKSVCRTLLDNPPRSIIKDICYPANKTFLSKATEWGCEHELHARHVYTKIMSDLHTSFDVKPVGFQINPNFPYLGASPDGLSLEASFKLF